MKNKVTAIVLSAGKGRRMGKDIPKQYIDVNGRPLLYYCLKTFEESPVEDVIIVTGRDEVDYVRSEIKEKFGLKKISCIVAGGAERYDSVLAGLKIAMLMHQKDTGSRIVLIHDGARPFVSIKNIKDVISAAAGNGAAVAAAPEKNTIKIADDKGFIASTTDRSRTWQIQTPQGFRLNLIAEAYGILEEGEGFTGVTDDAMVLEKVFPDMKIKLVDTGYDNFKVTTPLDLKLAEELTAGKQ